MPSTCNTTLLKAVIVLICSLESAHAGQLQAKAAKVDITKRKGLHVNDPLYVKALVIKNDTTTAVIITVDALALGEIGYIGNDYVPNVRARTAFGSETKSRQGHHRH